MSSEIIDSHVHLYPPEINRAPAAWAAAHAEPHWSLLCARTRKNGRPVQTFPDLATLLRAMDAAGVARAILQGWYWETPESCALQNAFYAECIRLHPDRLSACAAIHPRVGAARIRDEIHRAADTGFIGLGELSPHSQNIPVNDPALHAAIALAGELNLAVNLHVTESGEAGDKAGSAAGSAAGGAAGAKNYPGKIPTPLADFLAWAQAHPRTRFVLAHWGARLPLDARHAAAARAAKNIFYDTAATPLTYGGGTGSALIWREMPAAAGPDRILFGTDYPLILYPKTETAPSMSTLADEARASGLDERNLALIFSENAKRVYAL